MYRLFGVILLCALGCNSSPRDVPVTGTVTYQNQPVESGEIVFADAAGSAPSAHAQIVGGKYALRALPGAKQVRITATRETGKMLEGGMGVQVPERVDLIPAQYNTSTTLTCTVEPGDNKPLDFKLE